jgi:hypothetical protein
MEILSFQIFAGSFKCTDATFCYPNVSDGIKKLMDSVDEVKILLSKRLLPLLTISL